MGQRRWFGTDGIRGRVGKAPMTPEFVAALGAAAGKFFAKGKPGGKILVARDTRGSGPELEEALTAGIESAGLTALRVGVMPSGAAAMIVPAMGACAGAILSASHNPAEDNGL
jgi:phosphoglucosamine mutase